MNEHAKRQTANGTPYNPSGDLISRKSLKEEVVKLCERINANNGITVPTLAFTRIIDNAPTVEYTFEEAFQKTVCESKLYCPERPQGEYVNVSKLRLMTVEECAVHTIDYAMGWEACVKWIKKGGAE